MVAIRVGEKPSKGPPITPNKFLEQIQGKGYYGFFPNENWTPSVNLYETDAAYLVCVDLSGVDKEKIEIDVIEGRVRLRGNRAVPMWSGSGSTEPSGSRLRIHVMEIDHGPFARDVELPRDVYREKISAKYLDGMLWIELPKKH
jgi:HSP20 family protein